MSMEIVRNFGIDPLLLGAQVVNFLVVLFVLKKFLYKPILDLLQKRRNEIKQGIENTIDAQKKLDKAIQEEKTILRNANARGKKIIDNATKESFEIAIQIQNNAKKNAEKILLQARVRIDRETKEAERKLMEHVASTSLKFLQKALEQIFTKQQEEEVIKTALKKFKSIN